MVKWKKWILDPLSPDLRPPHPFERVSLVSPEDRAADGVAAALSDIGCEHALGNSRMVVARDNDRVGFESIQFEVGPGAIGFYF